MLEVTTSITDVIALIANVLTIAAVSSGAYYGYVKKHKNLIGFRLNEFFVSMLKVAIILFIGIVLFRIAFEPLFLILLVMIIGETNGSLWIPGYEWQYILAYMIVVILGLSTLWFISTLIWTGSISYIERLFKKRNELKTISVNSDNKLVILKAEYKTDKKSVDVTTKLNNMISNNKLIITSSNELAGDPDRGTPKVLKIQYQYGKEPAKTVEIPEHKTYTINQE